MKKKIQGLLLAGFLCMVATPASAVVTKAAIKDVSSELICSCGCETKVVATCGCGTADKTEADIARQLEAGKTKAQIIAAYVAVHGEKGLATPVASGFNLTAWLLPIFALAGGGAVIRTTVVRWRRRGREKEAQRGARPETSSTAVVKNQDRILRELEEMD